MIFPGCLNLLDCIRGTIEGLYIMHYAWSGTTTASNLLRAVNVTEPR